MRRVDKARGEDVRPKRHMSWEEYGRLEARLVKAVTTWLADNDQHVDVVLGIFRGGVILARSFVSRLGEVPFAILQPRAGAGGLPGCLGDMDVLALPEAERTSMTALLVDDISDTGYTFDGLKRCLQGLKFHVITAALVLKSYAAFVPDFYAEKDTTRDWIVFPWESN